MTVKIETAKYLGPPDAVFALTQLKEYFESKRDSAKEAAKAKASPVHATELNSEADAYDDAASMTADALQQFGRT